MTFRIPAQIRIGFATYNVETMTAGEAEAADHYGITDNNSQTIRLNAEGAPSRVVNTTLHEVFHGMWDMADLGDSEPEEKVVAAMANMMCQVMRDNPDMFFEMLDVLNPPPGIREQLDEFEVLISA